MRCRCDDAGRALAPELPRCRDTHHHIDTSPPVWAARTWKGAGVGVPYRARLNERTLLNLPGFHSGAYVYVYVEDTSQRDLIRQT